MPGGVAPTFGSEKVVALHGGVAATVAGVALHCATKVRVAAPYRLMFPLCHALCLYSLPNALPYLIWLWGGSMHTGIPASLSMTPLRCVVDFGVWFSQWILQ